MKKIVRMVMLILLMGLFSLEAIASDGIDDSKAGEILKEYHIVDPAFYNGENEVTRNDCAALILRTIGMIGGVMQSKYSQLSISDHAVVDIMEYYQKCRFTDLARYADYAVDAQIVLGEEISENGKVYVNILRAVTVKEAVALMVRCLKNSGLDRTDIEQTFKRGEEIGIIKATDAFYSRQDETIKPEELFIMLHRFLYQKRWLYYPPHIQYTHEIYKGFLKDDAEEMTYLEYIKNIEIYYPLDGEMLDKPVFD